VCLTSIQTLDEIRKLLHFKDSPNENCEGVNEVLDEHIGHVSQRIRELKQLEKQLKDLRSLCLQTHSAAQCEILKELTQAPDESGGSGRPGL